MSEDREKFSTTCYCTTQNNKDKRKDWVELLDLFERHQAVEIFDIKMICTKCSRSIEYRKDTYYGWVNWYANKRKKYDRLIRNKKCTRVNRED